ncbi:amino acid permease [Robiginitalea sp. M366]|uniref:amino acid permease n=1 Tax=Robiginitalea aestuariiviva TaxID=3036903 RepID=UPI00240E2D5F|nr:amino acid permease [Robiginitalea aestuariiviva]MDG1571131.1 amino acid permease [Robiginitalea aestuariiviva]
MSISLVVGNMIGAGVFLMPAALAQYGGISLAGWVISAAGALLIAQMFSRLSRLLTGRGGGPYAFARAGLGDYPGFLVAWGYWNSIWIANAAITIAFVGAASDLVPALQARPLLAMAMGMGTLWLLTGVNLLGLRRSGWLQLVSTALKLLPILVVIAGGWFFFRPEHFVPLNASGQSGLEAIAASGALTLYAFLGLESATVPADHIRDPGRNVPRATLVGTALTTVVYILGTVVVMGMVPMGELAASTAPFADAMRIISGKWGGVLVAGGMAVAAFGALNGWILIQGQVARATARDGLFPAVFGKENRFGVPGYGLVLGSVLSSLLVGMHYTEGLVEQFRFMILLSTFCTLVPYVGSALAYLVLSRRQRLGTPGVWILGGSTLAFSAWAIYGAGGPAVLWGLALLLLGTPVYWAVKRARRTNS